MPAAELITAGRAIGQADLMHAVGGKVLPTVASIDQCRRAAARSRRRVSYEALPPWPIPQLELLSTR